MKEKQPRRCETCGMGFRPMTDALWRIVQIEHNLMSLRHTPELRERFRQKVLGSLK